ncbi:MAG TPA: hypothetical protein VNF47_10285 [Streptosporangiaceae bacterium]|nr:hypothetical protein [Streptosporangiaceae bacterium]
MHELLAMRLDVQSHSLQDVADQALTWSWRGPESDRPQISATARDHVDAEADGYRVVADAWPATEATPALISLQLEHADQADAGIWWRTSVDLSQALPDDDVMMTLRLGREARGFRLMPAPYELRPPGLIRAIVYAGGCHDGSVNIPLPSTLLAGSVDQFCEDVVNAPERKLPILLVAGSFRDVERLSSALLGLAHVAVVGRLAWERLRGRAGVTSPPWGGAVLLWPRPLPDGGYDRRYPPQETFPLTDLRGRVFGTLSSLSVARVPRDPAYAAVRAADLEARRQKIAEEDSSGWRELAIDATEEVERLRAHNEELTSELVAVMEEKEVVERKLDAADQWLQYQERTSITHVDDDIDLLDLRIDDWAHFERHVTRLRSEAFVITDDVLSGLYRCPYPDPQRMWDHLVRLSRVAEDYRASDGDLGGRLKDYAAENHGIEIALTDSSIHRSVTLDGRDIDTVPHVKVDDYKNPAECGRIHFGIDGEGRRLVVDHIGLHL